MAFFAIPLCPRLLYNSSPPLLSSPLLSRRISSASSLRRILVRNPRSPLLPRTSSEPATKGFDAVGEGGGDEISRATLLWRAPKLPIYSVPSFPLTDVKVLDFLYSLEFSFLVGLTTTLILFCSHFHQIDGDLAVGKMSPLVRIGTKAGSSVVKLGVVSLYMFFYWCLANPKFFQ